MCFLVSYYYVECTDFMYDSVKILYKEIVKDIYIDFSSIIIDQVLK